MCVCVCVCVCASVGGGGGAGRCQVRLLQSAVHLHARVPCILTFF